MWVPTSRLSGMLLVSVIAVIFAGCDGGLIGIPGDGIDCGTSKPIVSLKMSQPAVTVPVGGNLTLDVLAKDSRGGIDSCAAIFADWSVRDSSVASVYLGLIKGNAVGATTVWVHYEKLVDSAKVTVTAP